MKKELLLFTVAAFGLQGLNHHLLAGPAFSGNDSVQIDAENEILRRQQNIALAEEAMARGDAALKAGNIEQAWTNYKQAVDLLPDSPHTKSVRARAMARYSSTAVRYSEFLVSQGEYAKAEAVAREVLEARYNPDYKPAAVFLSRLEQPDYFNKTITPEFAEDKDKVNSLLLEANGYYDSARYDLAIKRYQQVLAIDKYNSAAFRGMEQVELGKQRYYDSAYNDTRSRMLWQVEKAWERPKRKFDDSRSSATSSLQDERRGTELMMARLNRIIIPRIDFRDSTVRQAVTFLQQRSRDLDTTESSPEQRGVNIFLKLPTASTTTPPPTAEGEESPAAVVPTGDARITLNLSNVPLYEALRYVATLAGLKVKVEPFAVSLVPLSEPTDTLEQREFRVPPGFIAGASTAGADQAFVGPGKSESDGNAPRLSARQGAREFLESQGVEFPPGASATFNAGSSRLVVRNTAPNLDLIESLVEAALGDQPTQVEIESKFVDISQNNLKELGFDWALGPFAIGDTGMYGAGGEAALNPSTGQSSIWPFVNPNGQVVGQDSITRGLRTGTEALQTASINRLLDPLNQLVGPAPGILSLAGVFTQPQFQLVIQALNQKKGVDLMAAPKVTTKSGQRATINIVREFPYPQEFEPPQIPQSTGTTTTGTTVLVPGIASNNQQDPIVTPSFPTDFTTRKLGVSLEVEPQIGPDGYTIDLNLSPEVVDFDGFINYGSPIFAPERVGFTGGVVNPSSSIQTVLGQAVFAPQLLTDNVINQPIFSVRKVTTNVSIWDGQTVALGGLIREDVQKINDKVPIIGDIPMAGALFRSEVDQKIKRNLVIFVTARLMDAAGQPLRPEDDTDQEELVEPLGLPEQLKKPSVTAKGFRQK
jgi:general secretion pathway protein D